MLQTPDRTIETSGTVRRPQGLPQRRTQRSQSHPPIGAPMAIASQLHEEKNPEYRSPTCRCSLKYVKNHVRKTNPPRP